MIQREFRSKTLTDCLLKHGLFKTLKFGKSLLLDQRLEYLVALAIKPLQVGLIWVLDIRDDHHF